MQSGRGIRSNATKRNRIGGTFFQTQPNATFRSMHSLKRKFETLRLPNAQPPKHQTQLKRPFECH
eukprot:11158465-Lingulodinium_polyedra.AAC.1